MIDMGRSWLDQFHHNYSQYACIRRDPDGVSVAIHVFPFVKQQTSHIGQCF